MVGGVVEGGRGVGGAVAGGGEGWGLCMKGAATAGIYTEGIEGRERYVKETEIVMLKIGLEIYI